MLGRPRAFVGRERGVVVGLEDCLLGIRLGSLVGRFCGGGLAVVSSNEELASAVDGLKNLQSSLLDGL